MLEANSRSFITPSGRMVYYDRSFSLLSDIEGMIEEACREQTEEGEGIGYAASLGVVKDGEGPPRPVVTLIFTGPAPTSDEPGRLALASYVLDHPEPTYETVGELVAKALVNLRGYNTMAAHRDTEQTEEPETDQDEESGQ